MVRVRPLVVLLATFAMGVSACSSSSGGGAPSGAVSAVPAANAATAPLLPRDARSLPSFDFDRYLRLLDQLRGTPVVVNVWASWCGPCTEEAPHLASAAARFGSRVQFLGIDILDSRTSARAFMDRFGWTYPSVYDETGSIRDRLGFIGQPVTVFYDASGRIVSSWSGAISDQLLIQRVRSLASAG